MYQKPPSRYAYGIKLKILFRLILKLSHSQDFQKHLTSDFDLEVELSDIQTCLTFFSRYTYSINSKLLGCFVL